VAQSCLGRALRNDPRFPEHRAFLGGESLGAAAKRLRRAVPEKKLAINAACCSGSADRQSGAAMATLTVAMS